MGHVARCTVIVALIALAILLGMRLDDANGDDDASSFAQLVELLDDPSFQTRRAAARQLIAAGTSRPHGDVVVTDVTKTLRDGLSHASLEVRIAAEETLRTIEQIRRDEQMDRLLNPRSDAATIRLDGWNAFSILAGDDMAARTLFSAASEQYPSELRELENQQSAQSLRRLTKKIDPYRLPPENAVSWAMLLWLDMENRSSTMSNLTSRLSMALSSTAMGPKVESRRDAEVLRRIIDHWVRIGENHCPARDRLLISMRYGCHDRAAEICERVFGNSSASPSTQVMALLCASALGRSDIESQSKQRLGDDRTAHVWQLIASRKTKIRTQVRDVALAILLHHNGIDPRKAGFDELQADPILIFRDHSLGFPSEESRRASYQTAMKMLSSVDE